MQRERLTDHIYVFRSGLYAQVTAGLALTDDGAVLIDTLLYPEETLRIRRFIEKGLGTRVRYVINTHYHADHTTGACFFPDAQVISHSLCRELLSSRGHEALRRMQAANSDFNEVQVALPTRAFQDALTLEVGGCRLELRHSPGHSPDSITCQVDEDTLFAADTLMPVPYFVDGDIAQLAASLRRLTDCDCENLVQGHGEIILRGETQEKIASDLDYLRRLDAGVREGLARGDDDIETRLTLTDCGKQHDLLQGLAGQLHRDNLRALHAQLQAELQTGPITTREGLQAWTQMQLI